ncbi:Uu.00g119750.m01.CDS01 [Anthostomella pinea]|uniref:Uu.00g119750.m01.CDS01 n=1 Tax=Anthostomella pinea TaxID=933095 RepID=A0AAI8VH69_9PEZI|nr:Uu.00g119750.m01.CDS01 [Anthostomella pinea]
MSSPSTIPPPRLITASNLPLSESAATSSHTEPAVEVLVDTLKQEPIPGGSLVRARVATHERVPTSNDGSGHSPLADVPAPGIVMPNGVNIYYLDVAPNTEGVMHRTTSTDYLVVLQGTLSLMTPRTSFDVGGSYGQPAETLCQPGEAVIQRGMLHALSNRTDQWVRVLGFVLDSQPNRVPVEAGPSAKQGDSKILQDAWLA